MLFRVFTLMIVLLLDSIDSRCVYTKCGISKNCNHKPQEERDVRTCVLPTDKLKFGGLGGDIPHMEDHDIPSGPYKSNHTNHIF